MRPDEIATKSDIESLSKVIKELCDLIKANNNSSDRSFLRSSDVRKLLNISDGTLQRLRISGKLNAKKINGTWFYNLEEINKMFKANENE